MAPAPVPPAYRNRNRRLPSGAGAGVRSHVEHEEFLRFAAPLVLEEDEIGSAAVESRISDLVEHRISAGRDSASRVTGSGTRQAAMPREDSGQSEPALRRTPPDPTTPLRPLLPLEA